MLQFLKDNSNLLKLIGILAGFALFSCLLQYLRLQRTGGQTFVFFYWNLFLAWIPLGLSLIMYTSSKLNTKNFLIFAIIGPLWLLFYPNAPYILTDLLHLKVRAGIPFWYDLMLILSFAMNGLLAGFLSLWIVQKILKDRIGQITAWFFVGGISFLSAYGIYLGRFERWNSWDLFFQCQKLLSELLNNLIHPLDHPKIVGFTLIMGTFLFFTYSTFSFMLNLNNSNLNRNKEKILK